MSDKTSRLGIMSAEDFKSQTKATASVCGFSSHFKSRGSSMDAIDQALAEWDVLHSGSKVNMAEQARLITLAKLKSGCRAYLATNDSKSSALSSYRRSVVQKLLQACEAAESYVGKRGKTNAAGGPGATKSLEAGYANERAQYTHFQKQSNPYSGTALHGAGKDPAAMGMGQFVATSAHLGVERVEFMKRDERVEHLLIVKDGLCYQGGVPYSCDTKSGTGYVAVKAATFAMDRYGNLFSKKVAAASREGLRFNHSTYLAGKEVICAGTITCLDGKLLKITNMSGHYRPNADALRSALIMIGSEGVDYLDRVAVEGFGCIAGDGYGKASTFVRTGAPSAADWPYPYVAGPSTATKVDHAGKQYDVWEPG
jgi:hypothetical protein